MSASPSNSAYKDYRAMVHPGSRGTISFKANTDMDSIDLTVPDVKNLNINLNQIRFEAGVNLGSLVH